MLDQEDHGLLKWAGGDQMVVIQGEENGPVHSGEVVNEGANEGLGLLGRRWEGLQHRLGQARTERRLKRGHDVGEETERVVVSLVQREPGGRKAGLA
jgi:hypothetical protein